MAQCSAVDCKIKIGRLVKCDGCIVREIHQKCFNAFHLLQNDFIYCSMECAQKGPILFANDIPMQLLKVNKKDLKSYLRYLKIRVVNEHDGKDLQRAKLVEKFVRYGEQCKLANRMLPVEKASAINEKVRLLHVLFCEDIVALLRLNTLEDTLFWENIAKEFKQSLKYDTVLYDEFKHVVNPSFDKPLGAFQLRQMWESMQNEYKIAIDRYKEEKRNTTDFVTSVISEDNWLHVHLNDVTQNTSVLYLHQLVQHQPDMKDFVMNSRPFKVSSFLRITKHASSSPSPTKKRKPSHTIDEYLENGLHHGFTEKHMQLLIDKSDHDKKEADARIALVHMELFQTKLNVINNMIQNNQDESLSTELNQKKTNLIHEIMQVL